MIDIKEVKLGDRVRSISASRKHLMNEGLIVAIHRTSPVCVTACRTREVWGLVVVESVVCGFYLEELELI